MYMLYLLEDDDNLNQLTTIYLQREGYSVKSFKEGQLMLDEINDSVDLFIIDIMLPDMDGYHVLKKIKEKYPNKPIIYTSARDGEIDRLYGYELGCDDYITKPFSPKELIIRVKKVLNYVYMRELNRDDQIKYKDYIIKFETRNVLKNGEIVELSTKEFELVILFVNNLGKAYSREEILYKVWGDEYFGSDRAVDDLIRRLRGKMPDFDITSIYGYGYRLS